MGDRIHIRLTGWVCLVLLMSVSQRAKAEPMYDLAWLDSMAVELPPGSGRPYLFSGRGTSFFYGTTKTIADDGWMGFHWGERKLFDDFIVAINGEPLDRSLARVSVRPHLVSFRWPGGVVVTVTPMGVDRDDLRFSPSGGDKDGTLSLFFVFPSQDELTPGKHNKAKGFQPIRVIANDDTFGVALCSDRWFSPVQMQTLDPAKAGNRVTRHLVGKSIQGAMFPGESAHVVFTYGVSQPEMAKNWQRLENRRYAQIEERKEWLLDAINRAGFHCTDDTVNRAVSWAKVSMAQLFAEEGSLLYAGLPWFNDGWARDTFISLPGAALTQGRFEDAAKILRRFAQWQNTDEHSPDFGRVPNRARFGELIYNTADGTPWFVRELYEYGLASGDRGLWREMLEPGGVVERSIEGTIKHHTDDYGYLVHGDAETWMDAVGPDGPWSPRGDRAVEVEVLWLTQLEAAAEMAEAVSDGAGTDSRVTRWRELADKLRGELPGSFVRPDSLGLYDHLLPDGTPDLKIRPNQLFALTVPLEPLFSKSVAAEIVRSVKNEETYRWGVASLAQSDPDFHPYHQTPEYPKDAAYHMGIVWTWLSGPYKSASHRGYAIAQNEMDQMLDWGAVGTLSENLDAVPREGQEWPRTSGTISQAWSLAEFLRCWSEDYIGLHPLFGSAENSWAFDPHIPLEWGDFSAIQSLGGLPVRLEVSRGKRIVNFRFSLLDTPRDTLTAFESVTLRPFIGSVPEDGAWTAPSVILTSQNPTVVLGYPRDGEKTIAVPDQDGVMRTVQSFTDTAEDEPFLTPEVAPGLKALQPPPWPLLSGTLVKAEGDDQQLVTEVADSTGDDTGGAGYGYPTASQFAEGILDLTRFTLKRDEALAYFTLTFRNLVDPGWHDAYGFQLTFATLAIRTDAPDRNRKRLVGRNSGYELPDSLAADRFIHVGGGLEVQDGSGTVLAQYIPSNSNQALGDVTTKTVSFALPLDMIGGDPAKWAITILVGAQDDHGGGGIGEFRAVSEKGGNWEGSGGGEGKPNVYDVLTVLPK